MKNLYTVKDNKTIIGLGISGPLTTPTYMELPNILKMIKAGYTIYQHNPYNKEEKVKVTIKNFNTLTFSISKGIAESNKRKEEQERKDSLNVQVNHKNDNKNNNKNNNNNKNDNQKAENIANAVQVTKADDFKKN